MIWPLLVLIAAAVLLYVCAPLFAPAPSQTKDDESLKAYRAEIDEIDRQLALATDDRAELMQAKTALQRKTLEHNEAQSAARSLAVKPLFFAIAAVFGFSTVILYSQLGTPSLVRSNSDAAQNIDGLSLDQLVVRLEETLKADPANPNGWILYARSLMTLSRYDEALQAYDQALTLTNSDEKIVNERASAVQYMSQIKQGQATNNPGPSAADVEAAASMTDDERDAMIQNMVDGLSERLVENPIDEAAWVRLLKARSVLGQSDQLKIEIDRMKQAYANSPDTIATILNASGLDTQ